MEWFFSGSCIHQGQCCQSVLNEHKSKAPPERTATKGLCKILTKVTGPVFSSVAVSLCRIFTLHNATSLTCNCKEHSTDNQGDKIAGDCCSVSALEQEPAASLAPLLLFAVGAVLFCGLVGKLEENH